ncbi:MAG: hypothetical protein WDW38_003899 [Sanguina aurantia]
MTASLKLIRVKRLPILHQLELEEALLRTTTSNWCIINDGAFNPAIVMGISGQAKLLVEVEAAKAAHMQVIKRFTGGGTVVVDHNTVFATFIMQGKSLEGVECFPHPVMRWTETVYKNVFKDTAAAFRLRDNDYVLGDHKIGGNAQAFTGQRWLHHTSFLWDYSASNMALLRHPAKTPAYREGREHLDFIVKLSDHFARREDLLSSMLAATHAIEGLTVQEISLEEASEHLKLPHLCGTKIVDLAALS